MSVNTLAVHVYPTQFLSAVTTCCLSEPSPNHFQSRSLPVVYVNKVTPLLITERQIVVYGSRIYLWSEMLVTELCFLLRPEHDDRDDVFRYFLVAVKASLSSRMITDEDFL